ncbi:uncharacterized protein LOC143367216 [Andrena cerasifolii]|uniref:uncharacterized protein LOC143367216 n=1 Tax=Andrena cerasifolii TaxID=2819439 RepID=UPI00403832D5
MSTTYVYITNIFYNLCVKNYRKFPVVLYVDGHSSHLTKELSDFCSGHEIELVALFPNATHLMQPMDVALFHPLKLSYRDAVHNWRMSNDGQQLNKAFFACVLKSALYALNFYTILQNGFKKCGLSPFCQDAIDYTKLITTIEKNNSEQCEIRNKGIDDSGMHQKHANYIESNIDGAILQQFKTNNNCEWNGPIELKELYNFWLGSTGTQISEVNSSLSADVSCNRMGISLSGIGSMECINEHTQDWADNVAHDISQNVNGSMECINEHTHDWADNVTHDISQNVNGSMECFKKRPSVIVLNSISETTNKTLPDVIGNYNSNIERSPTQSAFKEYLFWPKERKVDANIKRRIKKKLPYIATAPEWRKWHLLK